MRILFAALAVVFAFSSAEAREYGSYDPKRIFTVSESPSGTRYFIDLQYLDQILNDLSIHARNYPPDFDTPQDRQRAIQNITVLSGMLDVLVNDPNPSQGTLLRAGDLNSMGHNLDIIISSQRAFTCFQKLLAIAPDHPIGNFKYGKFLTGSNNPELAIPYLKKAHSSGVVDADFELALTYLALQDEKRALESMESYRRARPNDPKADHIIDAIQNGRIQYEILKP
ncbi:MAG TPA: hypothetical protein VN367_04110 [Chlorobaculum sp.]|nr:hypothetical protein [Chlorobaculum sp.]